MPFRSWLCCGAQKGSPIEYADPRPVVGGGQEARNLIVSSAVHGDGGAAQQVDGPVAEPDPARQSGRTARAAESYQKQSSSRLALTPAASGRSRVSAVSSSNAPETVSSSVAVPASSIDIASTTTVGVPGRQASYASTCGLSHSQGGHSGLGADGCPNAAFPPQPAVPPIPMPSIPLPQLGHPAARSVNAGRASHSHHHQQKQQQEQALHDSITFVPAPPPSPGRSAAAPVASSGANAHTSAGYAGGGGGGGGSPPPDHLYQHYYQPMPGDSLGASAVRMGGSNCDGGSAAVSGAGLHAAGAAAASGEVIPSTVSAYTNTTMSAAHAAAANAQAYASNSPAVAGLAHWYQQHNASSQRAAGSAASLAHGAASEVLLANLLHVGQGGVGGGAYPAAASLPVSLENQYRTLQMFTVQHGGGVGPDGGAAAALPAGGGGKARAGMVPSYYAAAAAAVAAGGSNVRAMSQLVEVQALNRAGVAAADNSTESDIAQEQSLLAVTMGGGSSSSSPGGGAPGEMDDDTGNSSIAEVPLAYGRWLKVPNTCGSAAFFSFSQLCGASGLKAGVDDGGALAAPDYLALCRHFNELYITDVPQLGLTQRDEARRLVTLLDVAYDMKCRLLVSAAVPPDQLFAPLLEEARRLGINPRLGLGAGHPAPHRANHPAAHHNRAPPTPAAAATAPAAGSSAAGTDTATTSGGGSGGGGGGGSLSSAGGGGAWAGQRTSSPARPGDLVVPKAVWAEEVLMYHRAVSRLAEMCRLVDTRPVEADTEAATVAEAP